MSIHRLGLSRFMERGVGNGIVKYYLVSVLPDGPYSSPLEYAHSRIFARHVLNGDTYKLWFRLYYLLITTINIEKRTPQYTHMISLY